MGYMRHHAIVVTSWDGDLIAEARAKAAEIFPWVSPLSPEAVNGYRSFFVPPDGSKEGWEESAEGDRRRDAFVAWLRAREHEDGSSSLRWVEVQYGDDNHVTRVVRDGDETMRAE